MAGTPVSPAGEAGPTSQVSLITIVYKVGAAAGRLLPLEMGERLARWISPVLALAMDSHRRMVARHQYRALRWRVKLDSQTPGAQTQATVGLLKTRRSTRIAFELYARYWLEMFRLPALSADVLDAGFDVPDYAFISETLERGKGLIIALPHLGGWEWAGHWLTKVQQQKVTVVVEALDPPELFEWFADHRRSLGMNVVALGPGAGVEVLAALKRKEIVCLLCDRDIGGDGIEVDFLGERTKLPAGPALLALRSGAPLMPAAVYFAERGGHRVVVRPLINTERSDKLRADVARVTQDIADQLGLLIAAAPHQWHMFGPNWPSDIA